MIVGVVVLIVVAVTFVVVFVRRRPDLLTFEKAQDSSDPMAEHPCLGFLLARRAGGLHSDYSSPAPGVKRRCDDDEEEEENRVRGQRRERAEKKQSHRIPG